MIKDIRHFTNELNLIVDPQIRQFVAMFLDYDTPDYFWTIGASSTGKFHPKLSQGTGGLVRHVKCAVRFAEELLSLNTYGYMKQDYKDYAIAALIMHDCLKYGCGHEPDKKAYADHGYNCSLLVTDVWKHYFDEQAPDLLVMAIASHMGQWHGPNEPKPFTPIDRLVHMADYISSRSFIDVPEIMEDWQKVAELGEG